LPIDLAGHSNVDGQELQGRHKMILVGCVGNRRDTAFVAYRQSNLASGAILSMKLCLNAATKSFSAPSNWFLRPVQSRIH
jgi:hypothetical protein